MSELPAFTCYHCHESIGNPHTSLDRKVVRREAGAERVTLHIIEDQQLFTYCDEDCWRHHEPAVIAQLRLQTAYPDGGAVVPCCRCGSPVCRDAPHVVYGVTTMRLTDAPDAYIGEVLHERDLAVLCSGCEDPEFSPADEDQAELEPQQ